MKICLNCGEALLDAAKKCPACGAKDKGFPIVDRTDAAKIEEIRASVPHPRNGGAPKWEKNVELKAQFRAEEQRKKDTSPAAQRQAARERITANKQNGIACCPKCGSTSISAEKQGFGFGKAAAGVWAFGALGALAGSVGAKKVTATCLNCGHQWKP